MFLRRSLAASRSTRQEGNLRPIAGSADKGGQDKTPHQPLALSRNDLIEPLNLRSSRSGDPRYALQTTSAPRRGARRRMAPAAQPAPSSSQLFFDAQADSGTLPG